MPRIAAIVINYNTAQLTERSVRSLLQSDDVCVVHLMDNGSMTADVIELQRISSLDSRIELILSPRNLGFADGCNSAIEHLMRETLCDAFLLLNSDAVLHEQGLRSLLSVYRPEDGVDLCGGRVLKPDGSVDSRGIAFYVSCLASNRQQMSEVLFGPTGACALYSRTMLEKLRSVHGYIFDGRYFCYAEDTDLAARALLLGYKPGYTDDVVAIHEGQASSGGSFNDFILYHGIRNSIWVAVKCMPGAVLLLLAPLAVTMYCAIAVRHCRGGSARVTLRIYLDAARSLPSVWRQRRVTQSTRTVSSLDFLSFLTKSFYERSYLRRALLELFKVIR